MSKTISREALLQCLNAVAPGLSAREIIEQSSCFVFDKGKLMTFNDEISCAIPCDLGFTGAVQSAPFLSLLTKMNEDELEILATDPTDGKPGELIVKGKRRKAGLIRENNVLLPVNSVEKPVNWKDLPPNFLESLNLVQHCASTDESASFALVCVHIHPKRMEACDNYQMAQVKMKTGVEKPMLVRRESLKQLSALGMTQLSESENWLHFRNPLGLVLSCRRYSEEYPDLTKLIMGEGSPIELPKGLAEAAEKASVFSADNSEENFVTVSLVGERLKLRGEGACGWYEELKKVKYTGPDLEFVLSPKLLIQVTRDHNNFEIMEGRLCVRSGKFAYVTCLAAPKAGKAAKPAKSKAATSDDE